MRERHVSADEGMSIGHEVEWYREGLSLSSLQPHWLWGTEVFLFIPQIIQSPAAKQYFNRKKMEDLKMKNFDKYEKAYFMPPECTYDWVKKRFHHKATDLVFRRFA